jgi:hypothetical protein
MYAILSHIAGTFKKHGETIGCTSSSSHSKLARQCFALLHRRNKRSSTPRPHSAHAKKSAPTTTHEKQKSKKRSIHRYFRYDIVSTTDIMALHPNSFSLQDIVLYMQIHVYTRDGGVRVDVLCRLGQRSSVPKGPTHRGSERHHSACCSVFITSFICGEIISQIRRNFAGREMVPSPSEL